MRVALMGREGFVVRDHGGRGAVARGARGGRDHCAGARGGWPPRALPLRRSDGAVRRLCAGIPQIVSAVDVPVIAAGGIADAAGVAAALALGAAAVQVGTAYLLCPEATTGRVHRTLLASDAAHHTAITNVFTGGLPGASSTASCADRPDASRSTALPSRGKRGSFRSGRKRRRKAAAISRRCGRGGTDGCRAIPAADLTRALAGGVSRCRS